MPFILAIVVILIILVYFFFRSSDKFTRGGDINKQGEEMGKSSIFDMENEDPESAKPDDND